MARGKPHARQSLLGWWLQLGKGLRSIDLSMLRPCCGTLYLRMPFHSSNAEFRGMAAGMVLLAEACSSHLSIDATTQEQIRSIHRAQSSTSHPVFRRRWQCRSAGSQVNWEEVAVETEKPAKAITSRSARTRPSTFLDFEFIEGGLEEHARQSHESHETWISLREAVQLSLSRCNLDTFLWWRHAADARKRLLSWKSTVRTPEDAADATAIIVSCARARVEPRTGVYASWIRAVLAASSNTKPLFSIGDVSAAAAFLGTTGALPADARFWYDGFPSVVSAGASSASASDLARAAAAYACISLSAAPGEAGETVFVQVESQLPHVEVSAHDAAVFLWAQRRCGRLSTATVLDLWVGSLDGRLSELSPVLLAAVSHAVANAGLPALSAAKSPAAQLLRSLSRRDSAASVDLLCRSAGALADAGWPNVQREREREGEAEGYRWRSAPAGVTPTPQRKKRGRERPDSPPGAPGARGFSPKPCRRRRRRRRRGRRLPYNP